MITPRLYGRLGNQCFQIAAAIAHAKKMQTTWSIPRATQDPRVWPNYFLQTVKRENITIYSTRALHKEARHCYDPLPLIADMTIDGYFQSEKYFADAKEEVGNALGFHCNKQDYIAIHVRRGDYVTHFVDRHPPLAVTYYTQAIALLIANGFMKYKVYSDDMEWCKRNIPIGPFPEITFSHIKDPLTDMRDMYNAAGFIIANSTFSLFPALLRLDNPVVIAPAEARWYGPLNSHLQTQDLMPERFIKL